MRYKVAIVGAGVIEITNAVRLLPEEFSVTIFSKDEMSRLKQIQMRP